MTSFAKKAKAELGEFSKEATGKNASKDSFGFISRWGLTWKVPITNFAYKDKLGHDVVVSYIKPRDFIRFLLMKAPELLMGGFVALEAGRAQLKAFWDSYENLHPTHRLFQNPHPVRSRSNTLALAMHGDEGRGKKRNNTCVIMLEACLGVDTAQNYRNNTRFDQCDECNLRSPCAKRFKTNPGFQVEAPHDPAFQSHNTRNNSFLTKFVMSVLPGELYKETGALDEVLKRICHDLKDLFETGISIGDQGWYVALTGLKGDLRWFEKISNLHRCFNKQTARTGLQMCHECEAGGSSMPWEDASHSPCWANHLYKSRPWIVPPTILAIPFEPMDASGKPEMILRRDLFHNSKMGILRDYIASTLLFLIALGYFREQGPGISNARDVCLARAFRHFHLFCKTVGSQPGLRSFTPTFFNAKTQDDFGWINAKGSDVTMLVRWIAILTAGLLNDPLSHDHIPLLKRMYKAAMCVGTWQHILYNHGCWLSRHCAMVAYQEFHEFLQHYNGLAFECLTSYQFTGFAMKSKFHLLAHCKHELAMLLDQRPSISWIPNPLLFSTEMNEDVVGKLSRLSRRVSSRTEMKRTLQLYLCKSKAVHRRFVKTNQWTKAKFKRET